MASEKISQLTPVSNADIGNNSLIPLTDSSDNTTKSIELSQLDLRWSPASLEATVTDNQPMTEEGDLIYGAESGAPARLAGNTSSTAKVLTSTGDGTNASAPTWETPDPGTTVAVNGESPLTGAVTFTGGTDISLTQTGQNITIASTGLSGTVPITSGGTGETDASAAFDALSPMTTAGDLVYGGASGTGTRLAGPTPAMKHVLTSTGTGSVSQAPSWEPGGTAIAPTITKYLSGSGNYTPPVGCSYLIVSLAGGGGGGGANTSGNGTAGTATTFGSSLLTANGGGAGIGGFASSNNNAGGLGGTITVNSPALSIASIQGTQGGTGTVASASTFAFGGDGGAGFFGGQGAGGGPLEAGFDALANSGSGGGGAGGNAAASTNGGSGGGAGGYIRALISAPSGIYAYSVGGGGAGATGTNAGGHGGSGFIIIEEYYSPVVIGGSGGAVTPTVQRFLSGSGTYTPRSGVTYIEVEVSGGGGGGGGGGTSVVNGSAGSQTTFGPMTANGGGAPSGGSGGVGGTASITTSSTVIQILATQGGDGAPAAANANSSSGGNGGNNPLGGAGRASFAFPMTNGSDGHANTGGGGGGGGAGSGTSISGAAGGGAGGYAKALFISPSSPISYSVGTGGNGGVGSQTTGGKGGSGVIVVTEYYANGAIGTATTITGSINGSQVNGPLSSSIVQGTTAGGNATAGYIGEFISANSSSIAPVTTGVFVTIASISLTAGDWDVEGQGQMSTGSTTAATGYSCAISLNPTSIDTAGSGGVNQSFYTLAASSSYLLPTGKRRINVSSTTTVYLVGSLTFATLGGAQWQIASNIQARRVR